MYLHILIIIFVYCCSNCIANDVTHLFPSTLNCSVQLGKGSHTYLQHQFIQAMFLQAITMFRAECLTPTINIMCVYGLDVLNKDNNKISNSIFFHCLYFFEKP